jgi:hypothetical protein
MKVTLKFDGKSVSVSAPNGFELFVDGELLIAHEGEAGYETVKPLYATEKDLSEEAYCRDAYGRFCKAIEAAQAEEKCCGGKCKSAFPNTSGASSLFEDVKPPVKVRYIVKKVQNSSFISQIRWWNWEEALGYDALEVQLVDGRVFNYGDVPESVVEEWIKVVETGGSAGRFFNNRIKNEFEMLSEIELNP